MTKLISLAPALPILALVASVSAASAENSFTLDRVQSTASSVALANVQADQADRVKVYSCDGGAIGQDLGRAGVRAGANGALEVVLNQAMNERLLVVVVNSNHSVAELDVGQMLTN